jgi:hypothetical protein
MTGGVMPRWMKRFAIFIVPAMFACETLLAVPVPITVDAVARALPGFAQANVTLLTPVTARVKSPDMEVVQIVRQPGISYVQLRCRPTSDCLPFYVAVNAPIPAEFAGNHSPAHHSEPALVTAGNKALLVVEQGIVRLSIPVICLQTGRRAQAVRVRTKHNRILLAQVIGAGLLRGGVGEEK